MKIPFFVALLVLLALSAPCWSQETAKPNLAFDSTTMKYIWRETVPVDSVGRAELYQRAAQWVALMYKDSKRATRYDDKDAGVLIARGYWQKTFAQHWYTLRIECKDGRYRATLTDFTMYWLNVAIECLSEANKRGADTEKHTQLLYKLGESLLTDIEP